MSHVPIKVKPAPKTATVRCKPVWEWHCPHCVGVNLAYKQPGFLECCRKCGRDVWLKEA